MYMVRLVFCSLNLDLIVFTKLRPNTCAMLVILLQP